jgi:hypothetical protein
VKRIAKSNSCNPSGTDALLLLPFTSWADLLLRD